MNAIRGPYCRKYVGRLFDSPMDRASFLSLPSLQDFFPPVKVYIPWHPVADQGQDDFQSRAY